MWKCLLGVVLIVLAAGSSVGAKAADYRLLKLHDRYVKWNEPAFGTGATVRYAFVQRARRVPDAINCRNIAPLDTLLRRSGLAMTRFAAEVREAFDIWEAVADLHFRYVENPEAADVLIGAQGRPHGIAFANVSEERATTRPIATIRQAMICFNPRVPWELTVDGKEGTFNIRHVVAHEIGHVIGLDHPGRRGQLMGYDYSEALPGLQAGDIKGAVRLYGPRRIEGRPDAEASRRPIVIPPLD